MSPAAARHAASNAAAVGLPHTPASAASIPRWRMRLEEWVPTCDSSAPRFQRGLSLDATTRRSTQYRVPGTGEKPGSGAERELAREENQRPDRDRIKTGECASLHWVPGTAFNQSTAILSPA